ncbi:MAG: hypothetical protein QF536_10395, partial [Arenicellales bacterium]|nr:hypothetical protein [Arenicellales bacterium]
MVEQIPDVKMVTSTRSTIAADHTLPTLSEMVKKNQRKKTVHQALMRMTGCLLDQGIISEQEATDYQVAWTATELVTLEQDFNRAEEAWERLNEGVKSRCRAHRDPYQIHAEIRNFWVYDCKRLILLEIKDIKSDLAEIRAAQQDAAIAALQQQLKRQPAAGGGGGTSGGGGNWSYGNGGGGWNKGNKYNSGGGGHDRSPKRQKPNDVHERDANGYRINMDASGWTYVDDKDAVHETSSEGNPKCKPSVLWGGKTKDGQAACEHYNTRKGCWHKDCGKDHRPFTK